MRILNELTKTSPIIFLWVWTVLLSVGTLVATLVAGGFSRWWNAVICVLFVIIGVIGIIFWTPVYNQIQVYGDEKFSISQIQEDYNVISVDGLIVTLEHK